MITLPRRSLRAAKDLDNSEKGRVAASQLGNHLGLQLLDSKEVPVDPWALAEIENIRIVRSSTIAGPGRIGWSSDGLRILVRESDPPTRQRFTVAHELAHHLLFGIQDTGSPRCYSQEEEKRCDKFATSLLMPEEIFSEKYNELESLPCAKSVLELAGRFDVSLETTIVRVTELALLGRDTIILKCEFDSHNIGRVMCGGYYIGTFTRPLEGLTTQDLGMDGALESADVVLSGASNVRIPTTVRLPHKLRGFPKRAWSYVPAEVTFMPLRDDHKLMLVEIDLGAPHIKDGDETHEWARQERLKGAKIGAQM